MKTVLFDLDGTLLPMDTERFIKSYLKYLAAHFADLIDAQELVNRVLFATDMMVKNKDWRTNETIFLKYFSQNLAGELALYAARFSTFYDTGFLRLKKDLSSDPHVVDSIKMLKAKGYRLAVATNPIFPLKAILHRINWAGLAPEDFSYISCFEQNCYCKPNVEYYTEVLAAINESAVNCLMVGNDVQEDLVARQLGIKTYLVENCLIHRGGKFVTDYRGSYADFCRFVRGLPTVNP